MNKIKIVDVRLEQSEVIEALNHLISIYGDYVKIKSEKEIKDMICDYWLDMGKEIEESPDKYVDIDITKLLNKLV